MAKASGHIRIVDYKLAGKSSYTKKHLEKGQRLQLPLYAIAAQQTLRLGPIADGFYWHVVSAEASSLSLASFGVQEAIDTAEYHAHVAIAAIQDGDFAPQPPDGGCPSYCPALSFCWMAQPAR